MYSIRLFSVRRCGYLLLLIHFLPWKPGNFSFLFDEWLPSSFLLLTWLNSSASAGGMVEGIDPISGERPKAASYLAISLLIEPNSAKSLAKADVPSGILRHIANPISKCEFCKLFAFTLPNITIFGTQSKFLVWKIDLGESKWVSAITYENS